MKVEVRFNNTKTQVGDLTFNKTYNMFKLARHNKRALFLPEHSINYAVELTKSNTKRTKRSKRK